MTTKPTSKQVTHNGSSLHAFLAGIQSGTIDASDVTSALGYVPVNPANATLTGTPSAPTAGTGTATTQLATTAFVANAVAGLGAGGGSATELASSLGNTSDVAKGAALVGYSGRTLRAKLEDQVSLTDFGALGDGLLASAAANDAAIAAAIAYIATTGKSVFVPQGYYYCNPFTVNMSAYIQQASFFGNDRDRTVFKRATPGSGAFVTLGSAAGTVFQSGVQLSGLGFDGGALTNGPTVLMYDVVRSAILECAFVGGDIGCSMLGGISVNFSNCLFSGANIGLKINSFSSSAGGGWPNAISVTGGEIVDNSVWGLWFDGGRSVTLRNIDVEGNGSTAGSLSNGGIYVGPNIGLEVAVNDAINSGLSVSECWFESNKGVADIFAQGGISSISSSVFFSTQTTHDMRLDGYQYTIKDVNCSFSKTQNLLEGASTVAGNVIMGSQIPNIAYTAAKTTVLGSNRIFTNGGEAAVGVITKPLIQAGVDSSNSGTYIPFPVAYAAIPAIVVTPWGGASNELLSVKVTNATGAGFYLHKSYSEMADADTSTGNILSNFPYVCTWIALGTKA